MKFLSALLLFLVSALNAQDLNAFNAEYNKTYLETSQKDFRKAVRIADSLFRISETPALQARSLMLSAMLYSQSGEFKKSLDYALQAKVLAEQTDNAAAKAKIFGFLATHSRYVQLLDDSKKFTELGIAACHDIANPDLANNILGMMMQEKAYYDIEYKNYKKAIEKIKFAEFYFSKSKANNPFQLATNEQLLGDCSYYLGNSPAATRYYKKTLALLRGTPENYLHGLTHKGLAMIYLKEKKTGKAKEHLDAARRIAEKSSYLSLKKEINTASEAYYAATRNLSEYIKTKENQDTVKKKLDDNAQSFVTQSYKQAIRQNAVIQKSSFTKNIIIGLLAGLAAAGIILFCIYRNKQRKNTEHFRRMLKELDEKARAAAAHADGMSMAVSSEDHDGEIPAHTAESLNISSETVQKILEKLKAFEDSSRYITNNISLSYLSTFCETNTKYLSYVLNTYKEKDYHGYVNDLRIGYIILKLRNEPQYRKYKIAVLAQEAGFSSHTKFSSIFKRYTSFTPSVFIKYLEEGKEITDI